MSEIKDLGEEVGAIASGTVATREPSLASRLGPDGRVSTIAGPWAINPDTPSVIITPHGRIAISWATQSPGSAIDYSLAEETAAFIVRAVNSYDALYEALAAVDAMFSEPRKYNARTIAKQVRTALAAASSEVSA